MSDRQIFYDPQRKRWKRLRRMLDVAALALTVVLAIFIYNVFRQQTMPGLLLEPTKHNYKPINETQAQKALEQRLSHTARPAPRRKSNRKPSDIPFNTGEGLRAAFYVMDDAASYSSFKAHVHQIDMLFPEWLSIRSADATLMSIPKEGTSVPIIDGNTVHDPDELNEIKKVIQAAKEDVEIFPHLTSYDSSTGGFNPAIGQLIMDPAKRGHLRSQIVRFLVASPGYHGLSLDIENLPDEAQPAYLDFVQELYTDLHAHNLRLYINTAVSTDAADLKRLAANSDGILLMNYDEHEVESTPGPIASQSWFLNNLREVLKVVPKEKIICDIGNYGYDWTISIPTGKNQKPKALNTDVLALDEVWQRASDSDADLDLDYDSLNAHFSYIDEDQHVRHVVWFLDAVTALNEMRGARALGLQTFALWRLGEEDRSIWSIWDHPMQADATSQLGDVQPGPNLNTDGEGDILRITGLPSPGKRTVEVDTDEPDPRNRMIIDEHMDVYPHTYSIQYYGYHPNQVALTFDDGPDPKWTPKILDVLKREHVKAAFMLIGEEAQDNVGIMRRIVNEGHEIGNHTYTHPDISAIPPLQEQLEITLTERLFAAKLGVRPLYFRPPYSIDQQPDTDDQAEPAWRVQQMGLTIIGDQIDTNDWEIHPKKSPQEITEAVLNQLEQMKTRPQLRGSIILMHDGGGDRSATVAALPVLIDALRAHGYTLVTVSTLMGKTTADVMPALTTRQRWQAWADSVAFSVMSFFSHFVVMVFFVGDILMSGRLIIVGLFAVLDRLKGHPVNPTPEFQPKVAVLIPAYNEEKVIVRTIRSVLNSDYPNLRVFVIDDGSTDNTCGIAREAYAAEIAAGRVTVLTKSNGGKAAALNYAVGMLTEDFYVGIDADTVIATDAISKLIPHFQAPAIGAVAGNAKVGNRVNLWTRWQALEYITSQNFERRALDLFHVVTVVPGAIGAWRTANVRTAGGYPLNTVAEDADLTMNLLEQGQRVVYEDRALAFTEAPIDAKGLMRQRFRWSFGTLQAVWKHRAAFTRNKAMGLFALPNILIFQMLLPLVSPFIDLMFVAGVLHYFADRYFHPEAASAASFEKLLVYFLTFLVIDFITSSIAFSLEPRHPANKGDGWLLFHIWLQRFSYRQLFSLVLFKTVKRAIDGRPFNWDKLERTAQMSKQTDALMENK